MELPRGTETREAPVRPGARREIPSVSDRGATRPSGMRRASNAGGVAPAPPGRSLRARPRAPLLLDEPVSRARPAGLRLQLPLGLEPVLLVAPVLAAALL